ncbi:hypothetical protein IIA95_02650 [Patescibacteria group bacterium]|nr:hypothetical protein [Patescibacteria group bacterium]
MNPLYSTKIQNAFLEGRVLGLKEEGVKPQHIQTVISNVFLFPNTVYKIYKWDNTSFNKSFRDISKPDIRKQFYEEDFSWNHYFNNEVYQELLGVMVQREKVELTRLKNNTDDLVIQMKRIDDSYNLTNLLREQHIKTADARRIGFEMTKAIAEFPHRPETTKNWYDFMQIRFRDVEKFLHMAKPSVTEKEITYFMDKLRGYAKRNIEQFTSIDSDKLSVSIDNHSDNIIYRDKKTSFIDIYPPKEDWMFSDPFQNVCRLSVDIYALGGKKLADELIQGYQEYYKVQEIDERLKLFYQIYAAFIQIAYRFILSQPDEANKYKKFVEENIDDMLAA